MASSVIIPIVYSELFGATPDESDLQRQISSWHLEQTLDLIGRVTSLLRFGQPDYRTPEFQREFIERLRLNGYKSQLVKLVEEGRVFLYPEQLAVLIKNVVRYSTGTAWPTNFGDLLARAMLTISELRPTGTRTGKEASAADFIPVEIAGMFGFEDPYANTLLIY